MIWIAPHPSPSPLLKVRQEKSFLAFFYIHMGTVSIDKDTYLTPNHYYDKLGHPTIHSIIGIPHTQMPWKTLFSPNTIPQ